MNTSTEAREAILAHAARIESGELTWVPRLPGRGECCVGYVIPGDGSIRWVGQDVSDNVAHAVHNALDAEAQFRGAVNFVGWNDEYCRDAAEAVEFLRAAARRCYP